jgi:hypothetical protein
MSAPSTIVLYCTNSKVDEYEFDTFSHPGFSVLAYGKIAKWFFIMGTWTDYHTRKYGVLKNEAALTELFARLTSQQRLLDLLNAWSKFTGDNQADACDPQDKESTLASFIANQYLVLLKKETFRFADANDNLIMIARRAEAQELAAIGALARPITPG